MAHTDGHAKTEARVAKAQAANKKTYDKVKEEGPAKPTTPNETQKLADCPKYSTIHKCSLTRSDIYTRLMPDETTGALRIDGPILPNAPGGGAFICLKSDGKIVIRTGPKSTNTGSDKSGTLDIYTNGQLQRHEGLSIINYSSGGTEGGGQALNITATGDVVESAKGHERVIKARKIRIEASEELWLIGKTEVKIQAGSGGGGVISLSAGTIEQTADNSKETISGQKMVYGVSESQTEQFDPRANVVLNSSGQMNVNVVGAYNAKVGGAYNLDTVGAYVNKVGGLVDWKVGGAYNMDIGGLYSNKVAGAATISAGGTFIAAATGNSSITSAGNVTLASVGTITQQSGGDISITSATGGVNVSAKTDVKITGALIYLN